MVFLQQPQKIILSGPRLVGGQLFLRSAINVIAGAMSGMFLCRRHRLSVASRNGLTKRCFVPKQSTITITSTVTTTADGKITTLTRMTADHVGPQVCFVIGGPGSGKGTQCENIAREFGFIHLSAGELLRAERNREGSQLKTLIEDAIISGGTVPSEVIAQVLEKAMRAAGWGAAKFLVDGYPRSIEQLNGWDMTLSKKVRFLFCLSIDVGEEEMKKRLLGRAETSGRADDNAETIAKRFATYRAETGPLVEHFSSTGTLKIVDGERGRADVWNDVRNIYKHALENAAHKTT